MRLVLTLLVALATLSALGCAPDGGIVYTCTARDGSTCTADTSGWTAPQSEASCNTIASDWGDTPCPAARLAHCTVTGAITPSGGQATSVVSWYSGSLDAARINCTAFCASGGCTSTFAAP